VCTLGEVLYGKGKLDKFLRLLQILAVGKHGMCAAPFFVFEVVDKRINHGTNLLLKIRK
jgi:hypothetical protein